MRHRELKVGMYIIGKPNNGYAITNQYNTCQVLQVNRLDEKILVEVVRSGRPQDVGTKWFVDYKLFVKADADMTENKVPTPFPVGSYIVGNSKNGYGQTSKGVVCKVIGYKEYYYNKKSGLNSDYMGVKIIRNGEPIGTTYWVRPSYFDACDYKPYIGLFSKAYYGKKFIVDGSSISVNGVGKDSPCYAQLIKECVDSGIIKKGE